MRPFVPSQISTFIANRLPIAKATDSSYIVGVDFAYALAFVVRMVDSLPEHLLTMHEDASAEFWESVEAARTSVEIWRTGDRTHELRPLVGKAGRNPLSIIWQTVASLRDEGPAEQKRLEFIGDSELKVSLATDLAAVRDALDRGAWKAATVLGGSLTEALLLASLKPLTNAIQRGQQLHPKISDDLDDWNLAQLTDVALDLGMIGKSTASQCRIAKDFRNLVHPGRAVRLSQVCDRGTALAAAAAVELVIRELSARAA